MDSSNNTTFSERAANAEWLTLAEAIAAHVHDGDCVALGAPTSFHLLPDTRLFARASETCLWFE